MTKPTKPTQPSQVTRLAELQRNFINDCLSGKLKQGNILLAKEIDSSLISAKGLMGIYQNSAIANITHSLILTYPVIEKLLGEEFFSAMCREFIYITWPKSGNMDDYGAEFPDFLADFKHAKHLTYLKDVARLEWAFHQSSLANDAPISDWSTLAQASDILQLKFLVTPSLSLISSTFPIDKIWHLNQGNTSPDTEVEFVDEQDNDTFIVLFRQQLKTVVLPITVGEFALLYAFNNGETFEKTIVVASAKQAGFSIDDSLKKFIELGVIIGFVENFDTQS
ncbi:DNA-binding domain-containing protein [Candidatus Colwellia aromaticivorans]|uniref:HvfC/BufC N-terminal domain-containing protein n=1 Tax=Candidatus Colwellia aromaticivorans TaxID=2267621 RepID=UPI000DF26F1E|nr:DNA-binding domain-containing protein [Candidatus Colwellia aromaticivorans]